MKKINYWLASSSAALLLAVAPLLASAHTGSDNSVKANIQANTNAGLHLGQIFHWGDKDKDNHGNKDKKDKNHATSTHATSTRPDSGMRVGTVTAVNGPVLTISSFGKKATTTVSTNASTIVRADGQATTSNALTVGSKVFVAGTSTSDTNIAAAFISIFTRGFGFFKHFFH